MEPIQSASIGAIGYDPRTRELYIDFLQTGRYIYQNVPQEVYDGLMMSGSKGAYLHNQIKPRYHWIRA